MIQEKLSDELAAYRLAMRFTVECIKKHDRQYQDSVYIDLLHEGLSLLPDTDISKDAFRIIDNDGLYPDDAYYEKEHVDILNERQVDQITSVFTVGRKSSKRSYYMTSFDVPNPNRSYPKYVQRVTMYNLFKVQNKYVKEMVFCEKIQGLDKVDELIMKHLNLRNMDKVGNIIWMEMLRDKKKNTT